MALFPTYTFDQNTNYEAVFDTVSEIFSYLQFRGCGCDGCSVKSLLLDVDGLLQDIGDDPDEPTYQEAVKASYLLLYPKTSC